MNASREQLDRVLQVMKRRLQSVDLRAPARVAGRLWRRVVARPLVALVMVIALALSVGAILVASGMFDVRHVTIVGASRSTTARVNGYAKAVVGDSMMTANTSSLRRRVAALPQVADVHVSRVWPNTVRVTISERHPVLAVRQPRGWLLIDQSATGYLTVSRLPAGVLPLVVSDTAAANPMVRAAVAVARSLPPRVRGNVVSVEAPSAAGIRLLMRGGATVVWGSADDSSRKARALAVLLRRKARVYDVSTPGFITTS